MPRIISGTAKGIPLKAPHGDKTRPTSDKTKEALFSILAANLPGAVFLDLYAGSGQIGLEAASRGAEKVYMVEQAAAGLSIIRSNLEKTRLQAKAILLSGSVERNVRQLSEQNVLFDVIFLDPPWHQAIADFTRLSEYLAKLVSRDGIIVLEHDSKQEPPHDVRKLQWSRSCQYGSAMLSFYRKTETTAGTDKVMEAGS